MYPHSTKPDFVKAIEEEIDLAELLNTLKRYSRSIAVVALIIALLSGIYAYFSTSIYEAGLSLQVQSQSSAASQAKGDDFMNQALDAQGVNVDNEIAIVQSYSVVGKAIESLNLQTRYYVQSGFKSVELYKEAPFAVEAGFLPEHVSGYRFHIRPVDATHFNLTIEPTLKMKIASWIGATPGNQPLIRFSKNFTYDSAISHPWFTLVIRKTGEFDDRGYYFTLSSNEEMAAMVQQSLNVGLSAEKSSVIFLSYQDNCPQRAQEVLHALAQAYLEQTVETKNAGAARTLNFIDKQLEGINAALQSSAQNLELYKSSHIVIDLKDKGAIATQKLSDLESQMYELNMQASILENLQNYIQANQDIKGIDIGSINMVANSPLQTLIRSLQEAYNQQTALIVDYTDKHPSVIKINQQIASLKSNLQQTINSNLQGVMQRKATLNAIIAKNRAELEAIPVQEKQLAQLNNSFVVNQKIYEYLLQKRAETAIIESSTVSGVRIIDDAAVGGDPVKPKRLLILAVGLILGLIAGVAQALFRNYLNDTIQSIGDVDKRSALPLISVLPFFTDKKSLYKDALRVLLTKFEYSPDTEKPKVINFTSSVPGEGRTTTVTGFAEVAAQSGKKVILLDMDMRSPSIHDKLSLRNERGIGSYIEGKNTLEEVINRTVQKGLDVITSGPLTHGSYEMIMSEPFQTLLRTLRERYDYVLVVSPPAGVVADALLLMRLSDLNLFVARAKYSKRSFIKNIDRFVEEHGFANAGIILNGLELNKIRPWNKK